MTAYTPTPDDVLDMFAELPRSVRTAVISHVHSLNSRYRVTFTDVSDYDVAVAEAIAASGLLDVRRYGDGHGYRSVTFKANGATDVLRECVGRVFEIARTSQALNLIGAKRP